MPKKTAKKPRTFVQKVKNFIYPHEHNNHHPHAIRHQALALYIAILLTFNVGYNIFVAKSTKVLGFATAISQQEIIRLTNIERVKAGVGTVAENAQLDQSAMLKAKNMFEEDYWAHYAPSGKSPWYWFDQSGYAYTLAGENLARDFDTSQGVINGWMNSPSHKANMLAPGYQHIGIAVLNGVLGGRETTLVVQHFGTPVTVAANNQPSTQGAISSPPSNSPPSSPATPASQQPQSTPQIQEQNLVANQQTPKTSGAAGIPFISPATLASLPYQLLNPAPIGTWSIQQITTIIFLFSLMLLFIFDFSVLHKKRIIRPHSHSLLHAGMMGVAIVVVLYSTIGGVL